MTLEEKKVIVDFVINKLMGLQGFVDLIPRAFGLNEYDLDAKIVKGFDDSFRSRVERAYNQLTEVADFLHKLKVTE